MSDTTFPETSSEAEPSATESSSTAIHCALCQEPIGEGPLRYVNQQQVCFRCGEQVIAELAAERGRAAHYPGALAVGLGGALLGAAVWAAIAVVTDLEVGYVAVLVGFLAGLGVKFGAKKKKGVGLQGLAVALSVVGLLVAKYFTFAYFLAKMAGEQGVELSYFDSLILQAFPEALPKMLSGFDILWVILAIGAAYKIPAPSKVQVHEG